MHQRSSITILFLLSLFVSGTANAAGGPELSSCADKATAAARELLRGGKNAASTLEALQRDCPDDNDADFLSGMSAVNEGNYDKAIEYFRQILNRTPNAARVRLELARAYFLKGDDAKADHHFRLAQAGDLPEAVDKNVNLMLDRIRARRNWSLSLSFNIAPDSNINGATDESTVNIYGLPFRLSDEARRKSGIGIGAGIDGAWYFPLRDGLRWQLGGAVSHTTYSGADLDDTTLAQYTGPRFTWAKNELDIAAVTTQRHFYGDWYSRSVGGRIAHRIDLTSRVTLKSTLGISHVDYLTVDGYDGPRSDVAVTGYYALTPSSFVSITAGIAREIAKEDIYSNRSWRAGAGYYRELPFGFSVLAEAEYRETDYDAAMPAFGMAREDSTREFRLRLFNKNIEFKGFTPTIGYVHTTRDSNIAMNAYTRDRIELGAVNRF